MFFFRFVSFSLLLLMMMMISSQSFFLVFFLVFSSSKSTTCFMREYVHGVFFLGKRWIILLEKFSNWFQCNFSWLLFLVVVVYHNCCKSYRLFFIHSFIHFYQCILNLVFSIFVVGCCFMDFSLHHHHHHLEMTYINIHESEYDDVSKFFSFLLLLLLLLIIIILNQSIYIGVDI